MERFYVKNSNNNRRGPEIIEREFEEGMLHIRFACQLCELQRSSGLLFLFEQAESATSWAQECLKGLGGKPGVMRISAHLCAFELQVSPD